MQFPFASRWLGPSGSAARARSRASGLVLALAGVLATVLAGCENPVDNAPNKLPSKLDASAVDAPTDASATVATCDCLKPGTWFRFDALSVTSLDADPDHALIGQLNSLWKVDIVGLELNFYFEVVEASADQVKFRVLNGARVGKAGATCLLAKTEASIVFPRKGCALAKSSPSSINVYAGTEKQTKNCAPTLAPLHAIPVRGATLQATVAGDCSTIEDGLVLSGGIAGSALEKTCTCLTTKGQTADDCKVPDPNYVDPTGGCDGCSTSYKNLLGFFKAFSGGEDPKYLCKSETGTPAVCLTASFHAVKIAAAPPLCP